MKCARHEKGTEKARTTVAQPPAETAKAGDSSLADLNPESRAFARRLCSSPDVLAYKGALGDKQDRHIVVVRRAAIQVDPEVSKIRAVDPDIETLVNSVKRMDGEPLYQPAVWARGDPIVFVLADGLQRLRTMADREHITVVVPQWWKSIEDVLAAGTDLNYSRFKMEDADLLSILGTGKLSLDRLKDLTGVKESKLRRLSSICQHAVLVQAVTGRNLDAAGRKVASGYFIGYVAAAKLVDCCEKNADKLAALLNSFTSEYELAKRNAQKVEAVLERNQTKSWPSSFKKRRYLEYYSGLIGWGSWEDAIRGDHIKKGRNGKWSLDLDQAGPQIETQGVSVSDSEKEWNEGFAVIGLEGLKWDKADPADLRDLLDHWSYIESRLSNALKTRQKGQPRPEKKEETEEPEEPAELDATDDVDQQQTQAEEDFEPEVDEDEDVEDEEVEA